MTMREHIQAIRAKVRDVRVEDGLIGGDDRITVLLDAALAAADEREREFERARKAQRVLDDNKSADPALHGAEYMAAITAEIDARRVVRAYFNPAKEG